MCEQQGITTVLVSTGRDLTAQVRPPRSLFVNFPMGNPFGPPGAVDLQRRILLDALHLAEADVAPGAIVDAPYEWPDDFTARVEATLLAMAPQGRT